MMRYFLIGIPSLLFEPIAVGAVFGIVASLLFYRQKHGRFYWVIAAAVFIMLFWRLLCHHIMLSTRYASILLYPAVIFTAWFCFYFSDMAQHYASKIPKLHNTKWSKKIILWFPRFLIAGLFLACLVKILHYNPHGKYLINTCKVLFSELSKEDFILYTHAEGRRIVYYTGLDIQKKKVIGINPAISINDFLKSKVHFCGNSFTPLYFVLFKKEGMQEPNSEFLGITQDAGKWECLYREYTSRKKNKEIVLYRFTPLHPNAEIWEKAIPEISSDNLCMNGDFEQILTGETLDHRIAHYKKIGTSSFYLTPDRILPAEWSLEVQKAVNGKSPEMALTTVNPIAGKFSMEMGTSLPYWGLVSHPMKKQNGMFSAFIRTYSDSTAYIYPGFWDESQKNTIFINKYMFQLPAGKIYHLFFPVCVTGVPQNIYFLIRGNGHILLDNVEFVPEQKGISIYSRIN